MTTIPLPPYVLLYAFRYALGRETTAPGDIAALLMRHWDAMGEEFQKQIVRDIEHEYRQQSMRFSRQWMNLAWPEWERLVKFVEGRE